MHAQEEEAEKFAEGKTNPQGGEDGFGGNGCVLLGQLLITASSLEWLKMDIRLLTSNFGLKPAPDGRTQPGSTCSWMQLCLG